MFDTDVEWAANHLKSLIGWTIVDTVRSDDNDSYGFIIKKGDTEKACWVDCDPEGNGPGWLAIEEIVR